MPAARSADPQGRILGGARGYAPDGRSDAIQGGEQAPRSDTLGLAVLRRPLPD